jgi:hypothetical protein
MKTFNKLWEEIEQGFEFEKIQKVMITLNWKWMSCNGVPNTAQIITQARSIAHKAYKNQGRVGTGGFFAESDGNTLTLWFAVDFIDVD